MRSIIDISVSISPSTPLWPNSDKVRIHLVSDLNAGDKTSVSAISMGTHTGTHIDAPSHMLKGAPSLDAIPPERFNGPAFVVDLRKHPQLNQAALQQAMIPENTKRLLLKTTNSELWEKNGVVFEKNFVALTEEAARWLVKKGIQTIGIDYLSIEAFGSCPYPVHKTLLKAGIVIIEGLNLKSVSEGTYELMGGPIKIAGAEAAPARFYLRPSDE